MAFGSGGTAPEIIGAMVKTKGEAFVKKLKTQEIRLFSMGSPAIRDQIAIGEIEASPVVFRPMRSKPPEKGAPIEWLPMDLVPVHAGAAIIAARAPHPHAALLMVDFLLECRRPKRPGKIQIRQRQPRTTVSSAGTLPRRSQHRPTRTPGDLLGKADAGNRQERWLVLGSD